MFNFIEIKDLTKYSTEIITTILNYLKKYYNE